MSRVPRPPEPLKFNPVPFRPQTQHADPGAREERKAPPLWTWNMRERSSWTLDTTLRQVERRLGQ